MVLINLENYLDDNVNIVEIFFVKNILENKMLDIAIGDNIIKNIKYKKNKDENYKKQFYKKRDEKMETAKNLRTESLNQFIRNGYHSFCKVWNGWFFWSNR